MRHHLALSRGDLPLAALKVPSLKIQAAALAAEGRWTVAQSVGALRRGWGMSSGLFGLHMKGMLMGELFTISRNW